MSGMAGFCSCQPQDRRLGAQTCRSNQAVVCLILSLPQLQFEYFLHPFTGRNAGTLCSHTALGTNSGQFYFATDVKGELTPVMILSSEIYSLAQRYVTNEEPSPFTTKIHRPFQLPPLSLNPESTFLGGLCSGPPGRLELGPVISLTGSRGTTVLLLGNWCICLMICGAT